MRVVLLNDFQESVDHELLKVLIAEYKKSLDATEDEIVDRLVTKMKNVFEEGLDADTLA